MCIRTVPVQDQPSRQELLVFEGDGAIEVKAIAGPARILLGTGRRHDYPLVLRSSSVHSNQQSLVRVHQRIEELGAKLRGAGQFTWQG